MGVPKMDVYRDENGNPAPDRDFREVPSNVMARYLGISPSALWRRVMGGMYRDAIVKIGAHRYFKPRKVMGIDERRTA